VALSRTPFSLFSLYFCLQIVRATFPSSLERKRENSALPLFTGEPEVGFCRTGSGLLAAKRLQMGLWCQRKSNRDSYMLIRFPRRATRYCFRLNVNSLVCRQCYQYATITRFSLQSSTIPQLSAH